MCPLEKTNTNPWDIPLRLPGYDSYTSYPTVY